MLTNKHIIEICAQYTGLSVQELLSPSRKKLISQSRQLAMKIIRDENGNTYQEIALLFSRDHHTTVMSNIRTISTQIDENPSLKNKYIAISEEIKRQKPIIETQKIEALTNLTTRNDLSHDISMAISYLKKLEMEVQKIRRALENGNVDPQSYSKALLYLLDSANMAGISTNKIH